MRIAIIGAGAVGGWFGGRLVETGHDVVFIARGQTLTALQDTGITLNDAPPIPVAAVPALSEAGEVDVVLLAIKVTAETDLPGILAGLGEEVPVAVTQNSVEVPRLVADVVGEARTWPGVVRGYFHHTGPAAVEFHGGPISYTWGTWDGSTDPRVAELGVALTAAGVDAVIRDDIFVDVWAKAMFVVSTGALGALTGEPLGQLRTRYRDSLAAMMSEIHDTALAHGVPLPPAAVADTLAFADRMPPEATSSMHRDLTSGAPAGETELDAQVGAVCRMGRAAGVDTRLHDLLLAVLARRWHGGRGLTTLG